MKSLKILVIDDYESIRDVLNLILKKEHKVVTASSGEEGLKIFFQNNFDLVITDRNMPGMLGEEVIRKIKLSNPGTKTVLMSAMSAEEEDEIRPVAIAAGADYILNKDFLFSGTEKAIQKFFPALLVG